MRRPLPVAPLLSAVLLASLVHAPAAPAADIQAASTVTAVTVYPDRARVTRSAAVDLPGAGSAIVVVGGLPAQARKDTIQVAGESDAALTIRTVEARHAYLEQVAPERERALKDQLQAARDRRQTLADKITALKEQADFIRSVTEAAPPDAKSGLLTGKPSEWGAAWTTVGKGLEDTLKAQREQEIALRKVDAEVQRLEKELARISTGASEQTEVRVEVEAASAGTARLQVTYEVPAASWAPFYDARLDPEAATLELTLRAQVRQQTGEDWTDAALTLSTARPGSGAAMTEPASWFVGFEPPVASAPMRSMMKEEGFTDARGIVGGTAQNLPSVPAEEQVARADVGEFALSYRIPGTRTVPADAEPHSYAADRRSFPVRLQVRTYPAAEPVAYLYAVLTNNGAPLPAGQVNLFKGGALVGRAPMDAVRPGEERRLGFGPDDRVRVDEKVDTDQAGKSGLFGGKRRVERRYLIEVESFHTRPVDVSVYERLPVPRDEAIEVKYLDDWATSPTARDVDGDKGVVEWTDAFEAGEKRTLRFGYAVSYPKDRRVSGF